MTRRTILVLISLVGVIVPTAMLRGEEEAGICEGYVSHNRWLTPQTGSFSADATTTRSAANGIICGGTLQTEMWVSGYAAVSPDTHVYDSRAHDFQFVPAGGNFTVNSKHWWWRYVYYGIGLPHPKQASGYVPPAPTMCSPPIPDWYCTDGSGHVSADGCRCEYDTPVIVDAADNGYNLTSADNGVDFDIDGDGTLERVAWTALESDDAFLVLDRNGNGKIDDGSELFGNATPAYWNEAAPTSANGFTALKFAEGSSYGGGNADAIVTSADAVWPALRLWRDANHDGVTDDGELTAVSTTGLIGIDTRYRASRRRDRNGNSFSLRSRSYWVGANGHVTHRFVYDVSLATVR